MNTKVMLECALFANFVIGAGVLVLMFRKRLTREFSFLAALLVAECVEVAVSIPLLFFRKELGISKIICYDIYLYSHFVLFFIETSLLLLVIYSVFRQAMKPLEGLHRAGGVIFRWVFGVSIAISAGMALGPHVGGTAYVATLSGQIQQGTSVLILCLLLFVCFSIRYLGLTYRSHIFGISLGLGIFATISLVQSAWLSTNGAQSVYSPIYMVSAFGGCIAFLTWGAYFAMPEPKRQMVLLPTTSPYFLWNAISEALGDEPGFVAIAGFKPDMLAPAELTVLTAASKWAKERDDARERRAEEEVAEREAEATLARQHTMAFHSIAMPR